MNRIHLLFEKKKSGILSLYFTAGYPALNDTVRILTELQESGVDMVEIGMPFSDPLADGPVIQKSSQVALENGMSIQLLFQQLASIREHIHIPIILMGYLNPVLQFGMENFCKKCKETGIDGLILPDLPLSEYQEKYKTLVESHGLNMIFLITPQTSDKRILEIDNQSSGFIYMVSSSSITGAKSSIADSQKAYFNRVRSLNLKNPTIVGFGISNRQTFDIACEYAQGAIIGSAFINALAEGKEVKDFVKAIVRA